MPKRAYVDEDGLTDLGRNWRDVAIAHEKLIHDYMWDITRYRLKLGEDLQYGTLPTRYALAGGEKEKNEGDQPV